MTNQGSKRGASDVFGACEKLGFLRSEAEQILAEGVARKFPIWMSLTAVRGLFKHHKVEAPTDLLAFVFGPGNSDKQITNPFSVYGE